MQCARIVTPIFLHLRPQAFICLSLSLFHNDLYPVDRPVRCRNQRKMET